MRGYITEDARVLMEVSRMPPSLFCCLCANITEDSGGEGGVADITEDAGGKGGVADAALSTRPLRRPCSSILFC